LLPVHGAQTWQHCKTSGSALSSRRTEKCRFWGVWHLDLSSSFGQHCSAFVYAGELQGHGCSCVSGFVDDNVDRLQYLEHCCVCISTMQAESSSKPCYQPGDETMDLTKHTKSENALQCFTLACENRNATCQDPVPSRNATMSGAVL
jgi:hypothetical protein